MLIVIIGMLGIEFILTLSNPLKNVPPETNVKPSVVVYGTIHTDGKTIEISQLCRKHDKNYILYDVFCVQNEKVYFMFADRNKAARTWVIGSIDINTEAFYEHCRFSDAQEVYRHNHSSPYNNRNGYYIDGRIVLNDRVTVLSYDITSQHVYTYPYDDYDFPHTYIVGEATSTSEISIKTGTINKSFTLQEMAENSESIADIVELDQEKTWSGATYLQGFFSDNCVQRIDGHIYAVGSCLNYWGSSYAVILHYEPERGIWQYVSSVFADDTAHISCYLVPSC